MMKHQYNETDTLLLKSGEGRVYNCGTMRAVFKADENETSERYSISEWWLEPHSEGPGAHQHEENDEIFYGIEGTTEILVGEKWLEISRGEFLRIPAKTIHDFANRTNEQCGVLNFLYSRWFREKYAFNRKMV